MSCVLFEQKFFQKYNNLLEILEPNKWDTMRVKVYQNEFFQLKLFYLQGLIETKKQRLIHQQKRNKKLKKFINYFQEQLEIFLKVKVFFINAKIIYKTEIDLVLNQLKYYLYFSENFLKTYLEDEFYFFENWESIFKVLRNNSKFCNCFLITNSIEKFKNITENLDFFLNKIKIDLNSNKQVVFYEKKSKNCKQKLFNVETPKKFGQKAILKTKNLFIKKKFPKNSLFFVNNLQIDSNSNSYLNIYNDYLKTNGLEELKFHYEPYNIDNLSDSSNSVLNLKINLDECDSNSNNENENEFSLNDTNTSQTKDIIELKTKNEKEFNFNENNLNFNENELNYNVKELSSNENELSSNENELSYNEKELNSNGNDLKQIEIELKPIEINQQNFTKEYSSSLENKNSSTLTIEKKEKNINLNSKIDFTSSNEINENSKLFETKTLSKNNSQVDTHSLKKKCFSNVIENEIESNYCFTNLSENVCNLNDSKNTETIKLSNNLTQNSTQEVILIDNVVSQTLNQNESYSIDLVTQNTYTVSESKMSEESQVSKKSFNKEKFSDERTSDLIKNDKIEVNESVKDEKNLTVKNFNCITDKLDSNDPNFQIEVKQLTNDLVFDMTGYTLDDLNQNIFDELDEVKTSMDLSFANSSRTQTPVSNDKTISDNKTQEDYNLSSQIQFK